MPKIMVVDDDVEFTNLYKQYLKLIGFDTIVENKSSMAMEVARSVSPDLFVIDLMMPEPDGFQLCRMIRADPTLRRTPIIIVTALTDQDSRMVAIGAGANDYLTKPFHIDSLKSRINALLDSAK
jgi:DNA-binding response OmpR family regulator